MLFRCTLKLRKELGLNDRDIATETFPVADDFTEWYCDVTMIDRHKCVLCTQAQGKFFTRSHDA